MAVIAMVAGAASAHGDDFDAGAGPGGTQVGSDDEAGSADGREIEVAAGCAATQLGRRSLRLGDCGEDVRTLNWILKAKRYRVSLADDFEPPTDGAVRAFERRSDLAVDGVVERTTTSALVASMPRRIATWYGPGFFGNRTACGQRLRRRTIGVAHRSLPCGSRVVLRYEGRFLRTRVIDRGPYANGADWDLTQRAAALLGFEVTDAVRAAAIPKRATERR